jgi:hypothetical protein
MLTAHACPSLRHLNVSGLRLVANPEVEVILQGCPQLLTAVPGRAYGVLQGLRADRAMATPRHDEDRQRSGERSSSGSYATGRAGQGTSSDWAFSCASAPESESAAALEIASPTHDSDSDGLSLLSHLLLCSLLLALGDERKGWLREERRLRLGWEWTGRDVWRQPREVDSDGPNGGETLSKSTHSLSSSSSW